MNKKEYKKKQSGKDLTPYRGYKVRLYPTKEQEQKMFQHVNASRFIYNYCIDIQTKNYKNKGKYIKRFDMYKIIPVLRKQEEYTWMNEISYKTFTLTIDNNDEGFQRFFHNLKGYPKYKTKKKSKMIFPIRGDEIYCRNGFFSIEKIGRVRYKSNYKNLDLENINKFYKGHVEYIKSSKKWILSFTLKCEIQAFDKNNDNSFMGIDLGVKNLATISYKDKTIMFRNINKDKEMVQLERKLKHLQRVVSRKYRTNGSYKKTKRILYYENEINKVCAKLTNKRNNYIHHMTKYLVSLNPSRIVIEDLNVSGMMKNKHLSKHISDAKLYEVRRQLEYKCLWNGIQLIIVPRFYPSSKTCCRCGYIKKDLKLSDRIYTCPECGNKIDRDVNAAINLANYKG